MTDPIASLRKILRNGKHELDDDFAMIKSTLKNADLSIFHQFAPPPSGGGHQFLRAFRQECETRGLRVENNTISRTTRACLFNSFNFNGRRLRRQRRNSVLYVHRVDGPIDVYRGRNDGVDQQICQLNQEFADKTIFQSSYSLKKHLELGLNFKDPVVILNAVNPAIFHSKGHIEFSPNRNIRLIAVSWSDNPNKGANIYSWLDEHLDFTHFEFTFVGRSPVQFKNIRMVPPVPSEKLAEILRQNDIYITGSQNDPCSNSLLEALSCGLPALYLKSGGHPEIVKNAGLGFISPEEIPAALNKLVNGFETYRSQIDIPTLQDVTTQYLHNLEFN